MIDTHQLSHPHLTEIYNLDVGGVLAELESVRVSDGHSVAVFEKQTDFALRGAEFIQASNSQDGVLDKTEIAEVTENH